MESINEPEETFARRRLRALATAIVVGILLVAVAGCSKGAATYTVTGTVTFDGQPLAEGQIALMPVGDGAAAAGGAIVDGKFTIESLPGEKVVEINASRELASTDPVMNQPRREQYIPTRYNVESKLRATVTPDGPNRFDYELSSRPE